MGDHSKNSSSTGGFIYMAQGTIVDTGSTYRNGIASRGGAIYSIASQGTLTGTIFESNKASGSGGGLFGVGNTALKFENCTFDDNRAPLGEAIDVVNSDPSEMSEVENCTFTSTVGPTFIHATGGTLTVDSSTFQQTANNDPTTLSTTQLAALNQAAAIAAEGEPLLNITGSTFTDLLADSGIVLIRETERQTAPSSVLYEFSSNTFSHNIAYGTSGGAGIYIVNSGGANISSNTFVNNSALNGDGGAIKTD